MNPVIPGLRTIRYDARSPGKVDLVVQPGDTLTVSDDVATQLEAQSAQFKLYETPTPDAKTADKPPRKSAAKKG